MVACPVKMLCAVLIANLPCRLIPTSQMQTWSSIRPLALQAKEVAQELQNEVERWVQDCFSRTAERLRSHSECDWILRPNQVGTIFLNFT
mmetsp:Transcript_134362/g.232414  ORF Transcript_134362/g.232414 Transcript_134362/m.232414 type:complete len:90 (-) Transcript_134362:37-306(-)